MLFTLVLVFDSCKKTVNKNTASYKASSNFLTALEANKNDIGLVSFISPKNIELFQSNSTSTTQQISEDVVYLNFPQGTNAEYQAIFNNLQSIQGVTDLIHQADAMVQYEPSATNYNYSIEIPVQQVVNNLSPLVIEAKQYLQSKGFTNSDIDQMIAEEGGITEDLIPLVMVMATEEKKALLAYNSNFSIFNSAYAKPMNPYVKCAIVAIGADILFALGGSTASSWTLAAMKKAFGAVAKRMLGPIGVAFAVVSFGVCMAES